MPRIRTIKPEFWASEQIGDVSPNARLLFIALWNFSDDYGVHPDKPKELKAKVFPYDDITVDQVRGWLDDLVNVGLLRRIEARAKAYLFVTGWKNHQKIDKPNKEKRHLEDGELGEQSSTDRRTVDEASRRSRKEGSRKEGKGVEPEQTRASARAGGGQTNGHAAPMIPKGVHPDWQATYDAIVVELGNSPNLLNTSQIDRWLRAGGDLQADILPAVRSVIARERKLDPRWEPRGLGYFNGAIADAIAARTRPLQEGSAERGHQQKQRRIVSGDEVEAILAKLNNGRAGNA